MVSRNIFISLILSFIVISCGQEATSYLTKRSFGEVEDRSVSLFELGFKNGLQAKITNYGGIITSLSVPDKNGKIEEIVLGYDHLTGYLESTPYFGALIGRYGNRIARGKFSLNDETYELAINNGVNHLHGGLKGFDKVIWEVVATDRTNDSIRITLSYLSPDGEEGYPGNLKTTVQYTFTASSLSIEYRAETDAPTVVNLTNHSYFNLSGGVKGTILDHILFLDADAFLPVDSTLIPMGEFRPVNNTPFDFRVPKRIGEDITANNRQLEYGMGYDHCWILNGSITRKPRKVASLYHPESGRYIEVFTTESGIQFYTGNFLDGSISGSNGVRFDQRFGLCLETQHFPDSPNQDFPDVVLHPGETYLTKTIYRTTP